VRDSTLRQVLRLAVPALPVLAAEPLYLLVDTAAVGGLGGLELGALGVGAVILATLATQFTFLSYGTTARAARLHGAGRREDAVAEGVQATWIAAGLGLLIVLIGQVIARPVVELLAGEGELADAAAGWVRIAIWGAPLIMITLAGNGWMRGVQDTGSPLRYVLAGNAVSAVLCPLLVHTAGWGLNGSAYANVAGQTVAAVLFLAALRRAPLRPRFELIRAQLAVGRDLILRSLAFQACFVSAMAVAARYSVAAAGAHQVVLQLWNFLALVLDSLAIAAQALVGAALGARDERRAQSLARGLTGYGLVCGVITGVGFAAVAGLLPRVFTTDPGVLAEIPNAWWFFVALQPVAGVVFALDGVFLGAGDTRYLRTTTLLAALVGFLPLIWVAHLLGWGLPGIWTGLSAFMLIRLGALLLRARGAKWAVVGETL
jgi:putative MATE family efflux protein